MGRNAARDPYALEGFFLSQIPFAGAGAVRTKLSDSPANTPSIAVSIRDRPYELT
jgi:hypothetical protein